MALDDDLARIAAAAAEHGTVAGVLAAEPTGGRRFYLVAFEGGGWLVLDAVGAPVVRRADVRDAASIVAMCEVAGDLAGGGDLEALRAQLAQVRIVEQPPGIEEAEEAALALERTIGAPPRVATPTYLDDVGAATLALERELGEAGSPFSAAVRSTTGAVQEFVTDVERGYKLELSYRSRMSEGGFGFPFGGDPEDLLRGLREFAEQQAESVQETQREQFATLTLNTAVELTAAALSQIDIQGSADEQSAAMRDAMRVLFPEAVALVSAARQGFMREG